MPPYMCTPAMKSAIATPALTGGRIGEARDARDTHHRLHGEVHRRLVTVAAEPAVATAARIDRAADWPLASRVADAEPVHHARGEVLEHDVGDGDELEELLPAGRGLQVEADAALVDVEREERIPRSVRCRAVSQVVTARRFDLDDVGTRLREQKAGVSAVVDLAEIEDAQAVEWQRLVVVVRDPVAHDLLAGIMEGRLSMVKYRATVPIIRHWLHRTVARVTWVRGPFQRPVPRGGTNGQLLGI